MPDIAIVNPTVSAEPKDYTLTGTQELLLKSVRANIDGSGAASAFVPTLQLLAPDGTVMWEGFPVSSTAAGGSADVSWFPGGGVGTSAAAVAVVGARIENHAGQTVSTSTDTDLTYDTVAFDTAGMVNLGADNRKLTVTVGGLYLVLCESGWTYNSAGRRLTLIMQNGFYSTTPADAIAGGTSPAIWASPVGGNAGQPRTTTVAATLAQASAGDFFASGGNQDSGSSIVVNGLASGSNQDNFLAAILLGSI